jgi:hypothetical protein
MERSEDILCAGQESSCTSDIRTSSVQLRTVQNRTAAVWEEIQ